MLTLLPSVRERLVRKTFELPPNLEGVDHLAIDASSPASLLDGIGSAHCGSVSVQGQRK